MGKIVYDFREGLEPEKLIFKEETHRCREATYYSLYLLLCWSYACGWYALFHWAYINYEDITFWVLVGCWLAFVIIFIIIHIVNICIHKKKKAEKKRHELEKQMETDNKLNKRTEVSNQGNNKKMEMQFLNENEIVPKILN